jgi:hypothetical protein
VGLEKINNQIFNNLNERIMSELEKSPTSNQDGVIRWLGECIFPQPFHELDEKFGLEILVELAKSGLIVRSQAKCSFGSRYITTSKPTGRYIELSDKGWIAFEGLKAV